MDNLNQKQGCLFCGIARGDIPSYKLFEDGEFVVILDRFPSAPGHALVIPKAHADSVFDCDAEGAARMYRLAVKTARAVKSTLNADGVNILTNTGAAAGQTVLHLHTHIIPRFSGDTVDIRWKAQNPDDKTLEDLAKTIVLE